MGNKKFGDIHADHRSRMRETFKKTGLEGFSDIEKLEILLFHAIPFKDTNPIAHALLDEFKTFSGVINASFEALTKVKGVGENTALFFNLLNQTINEYYKSSNNMTEILNSRTAQLFCKNLFVGKQKEEIWAICLNSASEIINYKKLSIGSISSAILEIKDLTHFVLDCRSERVIITHNHPSGTPLPSKEDLSWTMNAMKALIANDIDVIDHIIVSPRGTYSMASAKYIQQFKQSLPSTKVSSLANKHGKMKPYQIIEE
ncbi:MAG: RadC family protein [Clostridia bacterium]|nr:RadC family protein [Clostridia bacterium]